MIKRTYLVVIMAMVIALAPSTALAGQATSLLTWRAQVWLDAFGWTVACMTAGVTTNGANPVGHQGSLRTYDAIDNNCGGLRQLPTGWHGVTLDGYRNGAFCGTTFYVYSAAPRSIHDVGAINLCTNPAGNQNFHTNAFGRVYSGSFYHNIPGISSPGQNG